MNPFYDLNKRLAGIGQEEKQITESKSAPKTEVVKTLEQALRSDLKSLMEDASGGVAQGNTLEGKTKSYSAKNAAAGKDIGKPGKNFAKIAKSSGGGEKGKRIAGAVLAKLRAAKGAIEEASTDHPEDFEFPNDGRYGYKMGGGGHAYGSHGQFSSSGLNVYDKVSKKIVNHPDFTYFDEEPDQEELKYWFYEPQTEFDESGAGGIHGKMPDPMTAKDQQRKMNPPRSLEETDPEDSNDEDIMAYLNRKLAPHDAQQQAKENAVARPYNKGTGKPDAHNGMEFEGASSSFTPQDVQAALNYENPVGHIYKIVNGKVRFNLMNMDRMALDKLLSRPLATQQDWDALKKQMKQALASQISEEGNVMADEGTAFTGKLKSTPKGGTFDLDGHEYKDTSDLDEAVSRKHFQQMADLLKNIEDPAKRKELAQHHASLFKLANPRFDHNKFMKAAGCMDEGVVGAALGGVAGAAVGGPVGAVRGAMAGNAIGNAISPDAAPEAEVDEGYAEMDAWLKQREAEKGTGRFDKKKISTGTVYTRKPETFASDDEEETSAEPRGRGRPKGPAKGPERVTKGAWKHKDGRVAEEDEEMVDEKAERGKRKFFDKLAPAAKQVAKVVGKITKSDDKAEKAGKRVTKDIEADNKKDSKKKTEGAKPDFLDVDKDGNKKEPFKKAVKDKEEKVDETTTSGSVAPASTTKSAKGGMSFGGGIYDSWNRQYQKLLAESVSVTQQSMKNEHAADGDEESITVTVTGDDVHRFKELLQAMGVDQGGHDHEVHGEEPCGTCGGIPCQCDELGHDEVADEGVLGTLGGAAIGGALGGPMGAAIGAVGGQELTKGGSGIIEADAPVSQNSPDYPTNQEESDDALQYSGGLNKPKSTGQTTIPVLASQEERQMSEGRSFLDLYKAFSRIMK